MEFILDYKQLGKRVKQFRQKKGYSQEEFAELCGISTTHLSHIECAHTKAALEKFVIMANVLEVTLDDLFCDSLQNSTIPYKNEIAELISLSRDKKVIVDTNIPISVLKEISDYNHVAVMLSPQSMSVERFFDRNDEEKQFIFSVIENCDDSDEVMANYKAGLELINSEKHYNEYAQSGFFTLVRDNREQDTRKEMCNKLAKHFGFLKNILGD